MKLILYSFRRTFDFKGRSKKNEFLAFFLAQLVVKIIFSALGVILNQYHSEEYYLTAISIFKWIVIGLFIFPFIAVSVRRMHDLNKSGKFVLINLFPIVGNMAFFLTAIRQGDAGENKYGPEDTGY